MVSIIVPTYNYASYIAETLGSVKNQLYKDWECIIVDDGSSDNTSEIVAQFAKEDQRFKYHYQENKGVSAARNSGLKIAKGDLIQFLDGDDLLQANKIKAQVELLESNEEIDIIYSDVRFFDDRAETILRSSFRGNKKDNWIPRLNGKGRDIVSQLASINFITMNSPLTRKALFDKVGYFNESMKGLEDWDFWMRCALEGCHFYFAENGNAFPLVRVHPGSLSTQKPTMTAGHFTFLKNCLQHRKLSLKYRFILFLKYVELFWDSIMKKGHFGSSYKFMAALSVLMLPLYLIIKVIRLI